MEIVFTVLGVAVLLTGVLFLAAVANAVLYKSQGRVLFMISHATGESMEPAIPDEHTVHISIYPYKIAVGDVVIFEQEGTYIGHRVVERDGEFVKIKGDNCEHADGWFHENEVMARLVGGGEPLTLNT